jgi:LPS sulfotransferase NodH
VSAGRGDDTDDGLSLVRAVAHAVWASNPDGQTVTVKAGDDNAHDALQRSSLV